jgi:alpha-beta hydrolase superfamily lysophospholipase
MTKHIPRPKRSVRTELGGFLRSAARLPAEARGFSKLPRGNGEPVLVVPGFMTSNLSTVVLRGFLQQRGYRVEGWTQGRNFGDVRTDTRGVLDHTRRLQAETGKSVRLVGWSLGGVIAREAARIAPKAVHQVVTMGSPVIGGPKYTVAANFYERRGYNLDHIESEFRRVAETPIKVPITILYSKSDRVVSWQACLDHHNPQAEHVEVQTTHAGLGFDAAVLRILAHRLA